MRINVHGYDGYRECVRGDGPSHHAYEHGYVSRYYYHVYGAHHRDCVSVHGQ